MLELLYYIEFSINVMLARIAIIKISKVFQRQKITHSSYIGEVRENENEIKQIKFSDQAMFSIFRDDICTCD